MYGNEDAEVVDGMSWDWSGIRYRLKSSHLSSVLGL